MASISKNIYRELKRAMNETKNDLIKAEVAALNRAGKTALSRTTRFVREKYNIKLKDIKPYTTFSKATKNRRSVQIRISEKGIPLEYYGARVKGRTKKKRGNVVYKEQRGKEVKLKKAFIARANKPGQLNTVFMRTGKERLPIKELFGKSAFQLFKSQKASDEMERIFYERFKIEMDYAVRAMQSGVFRESNH